MTTLKPLADDFALRSALALRALAAVPIDEQIAELAEELRDRKNFYPHRVTRGTMDADEATRHIAIWRAIIADHDPDMKAEPGIGWETRVREIRRELAIRRAAYPKWIEKPGNPLTATEAARKLDCLDAIHWRYWRGLFAFSAPGVDPRTDPARLERIALNEAAAPPDANRIAERNWRAIAKLMATGRKSDFRQPGEPWFKDAGLFAEAAMLDAFEADTLRRRVGKPVAEDRAGQLIDIRNWFRPYVPVADVMALWHARDTAPAEPEQAHAA